MFKPSIERGKKSSLAERYLGERAFQAEIKECTYVEVDVWRRNIKNTRLTNGECQGNTLGNGILLCRSFKCSPFALPEIPFFSL